VPIQPILFNLLARRRQDAKIKAGSYELKPGTTPQRLMTSWRAASSRRTLTIIEGWTFRDARCHRRHPGLKHDTMALPTRN
jgi:UPF0755 protein